ncbi:GntR family transcriptional regulator [Comamonas sp. GB3 AK4-5]|uniref:GntR family transcriptional regulator n=1 Tax=Comamonas sp. GB3 AK4-5 TaxID=3231487 RepID=UPI00351F4149
MSDSLLQPRSLSMAIADRLRQRILAHEWAPGASLNDADIAHGYGVNRASVREALKLLCHDGLLQAHPHHGMTVAVPNAAQLREALALQQWLGRFVREQGSGLPDNSLAYAMLRMAEQRVCLGHVPGAAAGWPAQRSRVA